MTQADNSYTSYKDIWRHELHRFRDSLETYKMDLPRECAHEWHHAITHIAIGYQNKGIDARSRELKNACDHVRRAHLDFLKVLILHIHNKHTPGSEAALNFHRAKMAARLVELDDVGGLHDDTIKAFRELINNHYPQGLPQPLSLTGCTRLDPQIEPNEALAGSNSKSNRLPSERQRALLWQWARLETVLISLLGERPYQVSFELLDSYVKFDELGESLEEQIAAFKYSILKLALQYDHTGALEKTLKNEPDYDKCIVLVENLLNDPCTRRDAAKTARDHSNIIDKAFNAVESFLGLST